MELDEEAIEAWQMEMSEQMDALLLYSENAPIRQPILLSIQQSAHDLRSRMLDAGYCSGR